MAHTKRRRDQELVLADGARLTIRPVTPDDRSALAAAFEHLSDESRYRRFLAPKARLTTTELSYLTDVDHRDHEALVAVHDEEIVGVARYIRDPESRSSAEVAVTVVDAWQRRGIGTSLLHALARRAQANGIRSFTAICLATNLDMLELLHSLGAVVRERLGGAGTTELEVELPTDASRDGLRTVLRQAASHSH